MHHNDIVPDDVIIDSFKILSRQRRSPHRKHGKHEEGKEPAKPEVSTQPEETAARPAPPKEREKEVPVEEILISRKSSSHSIFSGSHQSDSRDESLSRGDDMSYSAGSVSNTNDRTKKFFERFGRKYNTDKNDDRKAGMSGGDNQTNLSDEENPNYKDLDDEERRRRKNAKRRDNDDRRKTTWIPCTCPQYKVSKELVTRKDVQAIFFAKLIVIKVIQLLVINLVVFSVAYERESTVHFFKKSHDWVYLAYGIFVALLLCVRVGTSYRARWPPCVSFAVMIPLTVAISFTSACITVVYNSVLMPLIICTLLLSFLLLCFAPYLLRKFVMHRITNFIASGLTLMCSIVLIFLKEFESNPMTYWEFISRTWLPGMVLSQIVVQVSIIEIQRMLFGLCFNVSSKRWHIAAMYL